MYLKKIINKNPLVKKIIVTIYVSVMGFVYNARLFITRCRPIKVKYPGGEFLMLPYGQIAKIVWSGKFETKERSILSLFLKPGMKVSNIGANTGLYTLLASKIVGNEGCVHSFEPSTINFDLLVSNIALNNVNNIKANKLAVSDSTTILTLFTDPENPEYDAHFSVMRGVVDRSNKIEEVRAVSLDEYSDAQVEKIKFDVLIIDVEGHELSVLRGARKMLSENKSMIIMVECTNDLNEIHELLKEVGFKCISFNEFTHEMTASEYGRGNMFFAKWAN